MEEPFVSQLYLLEKFPGKGGWTFVRIPEIPPDKKAHFGWVRVKGTIDGFSISKYHLMPMGNGSLFLPVKLEIRKRIGKKEGDYVFVTLYPDIDPLVVPEEMLICIQYEPIALNFFNTLSESEKGYYITWIYSTKKEETKVKRMARAIDRLTLGKRMFDL